MRRGPGEKTTRLTLADVEELLKRRKTFLFDLYRIPFNGGKGGSPQPLPGASSNGMSNYFPKFSPDGKWIVFCQANSFMLLQPDSTLYILPAEGGEPRRLACNTGRMNSWHSWSPNGKWLVFSSKAFTPYTQLFLTHIDERGQSMRPVLLEQFTSADRAANIPEFVNALPEGIEKIRERFLDDDSYSTVAMANVRAGQLEQGEKAARKALAMNPKNPRALGYLGAVFVARKDYDEAERCFRESLGYEPTSPFVHFSLGKLLFLRGLTEQGLAEMRAGVKMDPDLYDGRFALGTALLRASRFAEAEEHFTEAARIWPTNVNAQCGLGEALRAQGKDEAALTHFTAALKQDANCVAGMMGIARIYAESSQPGLRNPAAAVQMAERAGQSDPGQRPRALTVVAAVSAGAGAYAEAVRFAEEALRLATAKGQAELAAEVRGQLDRYRAKAKKP
jgi:tetratricopeptide (TPR) repeat protein